MTSQCVNIYIIFVKRKKTKIDYFFTNALKYCTFLSYWILDEVNYKYLVGYCVFIHTWRHPYWIIG